MAAAILSRQQRRSSSNKPVDHAADVIKMNLAGTKYPVVSRVAKELGLATTNEDTNDCDVYWIDSAVTLEKFLEMKQYQKINHFPGMGEICRKDSLGRNMQRMRKESEGEYNFAPRTWVLPGEYNSLCSYIREFKRKRRAKTFIAKPHTGSMGNGISLARSVEDVPKDENMVVQEYLDKPLLLDGFKIDLRVYVLVTACNPLRIFVYKDGLVRLSTQQYTAPTDDNLHEQFMHLTNYSINKHSERFDTSEDYDKGSKRTIKYFNGWLTHNGYNVGEMWARIHDVIIKTLIVAYPHLVHAYNACRPGRGGKENCQCFEILGYDILLDRDLKPWLLEVNRSPSFGTDAQLDLEIKTGVIKDALEIINLNVSDRKRNIAAHKVASRRRLLITPSKPSSRYDFLAEQEDADYKIKKKKEEVKERLRQIRREKELEDYEDDHMGEYVRIFPTTDWARAKIYDGLMQTASKISLLGKSIARGSCPRRTSVCPSVLKLKEHELVDLLSQYEEEETGSSSDSPYASSQFCRPSTSATYLNYQPLSVQDSCSPMDAMYAVMAARVAEEEQTQRTMIALNEMKPSYPSKTQEEVQKVLDEVHRDMKTHQPNLASFWLVSLDNSKRKQLLAPLRESVKGIIHCYWRTANADSVRLFQILNRLFNFLLSHGGQGLWTVFVPLQKTWEASFREKSEVISVTEIVCCRRLVELCQASLIAGYYYHHLHKPPGTKTGRPQRRPSVIPRCPSLPTVRQLSSTSLTSQHRSQSFSAGLTSSPFYKPPSTSFRSKRSDSRLY